MRIISLIFFVMLIAGCGKPAEITIQTGNKEFAVDKLFTHEGCTVYRFSDHGYPRYYTNCRGETFSAYAETCGKGCTHTHNESIQTVMQ